MFYTDLKPEDYSLEASKDVKQGSRKPESSSMMEKLKAKVSRSRSREDGSGQGNRLSGGLGRRGAFGAFHFKAGKQTKELMSAVQAGDADKVRSVFVDGGAELAELDANDQALRLACRSGHVGVVSTLIQFGAKINAMGDNETAAMHVAARWGHDAVVNCLITAGANVNIHSKFERRTPAHIAATHGWNDVIQLLVENSSGEGVLDQRDIYGITPLHLAVRLGHMRVVETLLSEKRKVDVNAYDNDGWTALHLACEIGNVEMAKLLLDAGAQVDSQNKYGRTPLHWACEKNHFPVVKLLVQYNADSTILDRHDKRAYDYATSPAISQFVLVVCRSQSGDVGPNTAKADASISDYLKIDRRESFMRTISGTPLPSSEIEAFARALSDRMEGPAGSDDKDQNDNIQPRSAVGMKSPNSKAHIPAFEAIAEESEMGDSQSESEALTMELSRSMSLEGSPSAMEDSITEDDKRSVTTESSYPFNESGLITPIKFETVSVTPRKRYDSPRFQHVQRPAVEETGSDSGSVKELEDDMDQSQTCPGLQRQDSGIPHAAEAGRGMFVQLVAMVRSHYQQTIDQMSKLSSELAHTTTTHEALCADSVRNISNRLHRIQHSLLDFQEEFEQKRRTLHDVIEGMMKAIKRHFPERERLPVHMYYTFLVVLSQVVASRSGSWSKLILKLAISEEQKHDMLDSTRRVSKVETDRATQAVSCVLSTLADTNVTPIFTLLEYISRCDIYPQVVRDILHQFIARVCPDGKGMFGGKVCTLVNPCDSTYAIIYYAKLSVKIPFCYAKI